jgi:hypothetical protein
VVDKTWQCSAAEMERMMKVQDALLKAMAKKITWRAAAEIIGATDRTMRRWRERLEKHGYAGLADRRKGKQSAQRIPLARVEGVLGQTAQAGAAPAEAAATAADGDAAAHRWQQASLAERRSLV